jgi:hypothetical protein
MKRICRIFAALFLILALAAYLRLANHADNPGWYTDEGTHLAIAGQLLRGRIQYLAVNQSTLSRTISRRTASPSIRVFRRRALWSWTTSGATGRR